MSVSPQAGPQTKLNPGWFEMRDLNPWRQIHRPESILPDGRDVEQAANAICEEALQESRRRLHPLLQNAGLHSLDQRSDFLRAFRSALEKRIARTLVRWQPGIQAVYRYDEARLENIENWDGSIHLLLKVPRLSNGIRILGKKLDKNLVSYLEQSGWQRIRTRQSVLEIHQVTPPELRHGIGYGAMFFAVHTAPVRVWPQDHKCSR
jgi:hypothetical protein